jgi:hypothetical protein
MVFYLIYSKKIATIMKTTEGAHRDGLAAQTDGYS